VIPFWYFSALLLLSKCFAQRFGDIDQLPDHWMRPWGP
jgi:hypothetical protein